MDFGVGQVGLDRLERLTGHHLPNGLPIHRLRRRRKGIQVPQANYTAADIFDPWRDPASPKKGEIPGKGAIPRGFLQSG